MATEDDLKFITCPHGGPAEGCGYNGDADPPSREVSDFTQIRYCHAFGPQAKEGCLESIEQQEGSQD